MHATWKVRMKNTNVGHVLDFCFKQFIAKFDIGGQLVRGVDETGMGRA